MTNDMTERLLEVNETTKNDALSYFANNPIQGLTAASLGEEFAGKSII